MTKRISGIEQRENKREVNLERNIKRARRLVKKHIDFSVIMQSDNIQIAFNIMWQKFDNELRKDKNFRNYHTYVHGYHEAIRYCQDYIEDKEINVGFPKHIVVSDRPKSFRTESWFADGQRILSFYITWMTSLANKKQKLVLEDLMLSLIFHSTVLKAPVLQSILARVLDNTLKLEVIFELPVTNIIVDDKTYDTNTIINSQPVHQTQVFLSPLTARLIDLYSQQQDSNEKIDSFKIQSLYASLRMKQLGKSDSLDMSLNRFLKGSIYVSEDYLNLDLPEHTWYLLIGEDLAYSLPQDNWQSIVYDIYHSSETEQDVKPMLASDEVVKPRRINYFTATKISSLFKTTNNHKLSKAKFTDQLQELYDSLLLNKAPLNELAIVGWLLSKTDGHQVSSIQAYSNVITYRWLVVTEGLNLESYRAEDFHTLYSELIELGRSEKAKNKIAYYIDGIHRYLVNNYNVEPIALLSSTARAHHKTGYLSETMFQAILNNVQALKVSKDETEAIQLALILGQRCGLRIGEIVKIKLKDVAVTSSYLEVRDNEYGNNKSSSALRRVLLSHLLTVSDMILLKRVLLRRNQSIGDTLIASQAGTAYHAGDLSRILTSLIKTTTGLPYLTTHHLRHSCLTNFQLMSFLYDTDYTEATFDHFCSKALKNLLPYDDEKSREILTYIETSIQYKKVYALAGIAGHASPVTTFSSYIHLTDIQIGLLLYHIDFRLTSEHSLLLGIPRRRRSEFENQPLNLNDYFVKKMKLRPLTKPKASAELFRLGDEASNKPKRYSFDEVSQVLDAYIEKREFTHTELLAIFEIEQHIFDRWLKNAGQLKTNPMFQTIHGRPRLFAPGNHSDLLPTLDRFVDDRALMKQMTNKFRALYKDNKDTMHQFVLHTLTNSQYYKNHIHFNDFQVLDNYLKVLNRLVFKKNVRLKVYNYQQVNATDLKNWNLVMKRFLPSQLDIVQTNEIKDPVYQKKIRIELSLASQTEETRLKNREESGLHIKGWTVRTLQVFCHYVFIMIGERMTDSTN